MRSVLLILAALVSLIYAANPVGTWSSPCMGPTPISVGGVTQNLYIVETRTLADGLQFESESYYYLDAKCTTPLIIGRIQGTFTVSGSVTDNIYYPPTNGPPVLVEGIDVQGIAVVRTHYFITSLDDSISPTIQALCNLTFTPTPFVAFDIQVDGCMGIGVIGNGTCSTYLDLYFQQSSTIMNFGLGFGSYNTCGARNTILNPMNYTALPAPTLASGSYELGCTQFATVPMMLWNTYYLQLKADAGGNTGTYTLTSNTFNAATCAQSALFSTTVLSATYTLDGYGVVENYVLSAGRPIQLNLVFTSKSATPKTTIAVAGLEGFCAGVSFTLNQATELNTVGCESLGFPPSSSCHNLHFDIAQVALDGSGYYPGGATEFLHHCSEEDRVNTVSSQKWATYVQPTPTATATPTPTSSSSSLAANVLLLISLLVFVFQF